MRVIVRTPAIICAVRSHGEHGAIVRAMTEANGLLAGYVRGGRSRTLRPVLIPSNIVMAEYRSRNEEQLASLTVELQTSRGPLMAEPLAAAGLEWSTALAAFSLPEAHAYPDVFQSLDAVCSAIEAAPSARQWASVLASYEVLVLRALGYGGGQPAISEDWPETFALLNANGAQLGRHLFQGRAREMLEARSRLVERLKRAVA